MELEIKVMDQFVNEEGSDQERMCWGKIRSAMCEANSNDVLDEVRAELLHDAMGLLMNHKQHIDKQWIKEYEELLKRYSEHFI